MSQSATLCDTILLLIKFCHLHLKVYLRATISTPLTTAPDNQNPRRLVLNHLWMIFPQAIQDHFPKLLLISGAATAESSVTVSGSAFTFKFFFGYKSLLLPKKVQKKTIYGFTVNDLFIAKIQFISFCFHNLVTHGKCHPHIQHHLLFCTA